MEAQGFLQDMSFKKLLEKNKRYLIFTAALVTPGGFIALGAWKAYKVYQKKQAEKLAQPKTIQEYIDKLKEDAENDPE